MLILPQWTISWTVPAAMEKKNGKSNRIGEKKPTINLQKRKDVIDYCVHNNPIMDMNECSRLTKIPYSIFILNILFQVYK